MLKHIWRVSALVLVVVIAGVVYLGWPDKAQLDVALPKMVEGLGQDRNAAFSLDHGG